MQRLLTLCAFGALFSMFALAESWTGRLVDASCLDQQKNAAACDPTAGSTSFALVTAGKAYKLDETGNGKVTEALKSRADRSADPSKPASKQIAAKVTGAQDGETIKVESVDIQ